MLNRRLLILSSLICCFSLTLGQIQAPVRPLPRPLVNIQCGRSSILRTTGLVPPPANQQLPQTCTYTIIASSFFVCQMRLDFTRFSLPQPTVTAASPTEAYPSCNDGYLQVGDIKLCGENAGQHIYVPVNPRNIAERSLTITIVTNGNGLNANGRSDWQIAVNQLDCPLGQSRSMNSKFDIVNPMSASNASELARPARQPRVIVSDWLAPPGCLQFHAEPEGIIDSFNFNSGKGPYIGNMNYAICFRRLRHNREIQLTRTFFQLAVTDPQADGINEQCFEMENGVTAGRSEDFLFIPSAVVDLPDDPNNPGVNRRVRATRFCGTSLTKAIGPLVSSPPGPFHMIFNSDRYYYDNMEVGFRFQYSIV